MSENKQLIEYSHFLKQIKAQIQTSQVKAVIAVNSHLLYMYWTIGKHILLGQQQQGWGAKVIDNLSKDLKSEFPDQTGFSTRNLKYMRKFAAEYPEDVLLQIISQTDKKEGNTIVQAPLAQLEELFMQAPLARISWYHHVTLMDKVRDPDERIWYIQQTIENGWSRNVLLIQIETDLYNRQVQTKKITNFKSTLPARQSDLAEQMMKDPYIFDFVTIGEKVHERNIEDQLCNHITKFLLELGQGFSFIGRQYHLSVGDQDYYIDLLFYHIKLRCYVVVELKTGAFIPEYLGKLNFYINAVNNSLKTEQDNPTLGILLCKSKNEVIAEYALGGINRPIGIADYELSKIVPEELKSTLPTIEDLEKELEDI
ncbi:MAG: PDDEXK nuclease domain-containing protein [Tannerellaceae bacterium]|nr:PDDEXK nuclease domain-containing protein [Tannerellaceae bacterium]